MKLGWCQHEPEEGTRSTLVGGVQPNVPPGHRFDPGSRLGEFLARERSRSRCVCERLVGVVGDISRARRFSARAE